MLQNCWNPKRRHGAKVTGKNNTFAGTDPLIPKDISICICQIGGAILFRPES